MDYIIKAEIIITALHKAGQRLEDDDACGYGLKRSYTLFSVNIVFMDYNLTFADFKARLRSFAETAKKTARAKRQSNEKSG